MVTIADLARHAGVSSSTQAALIGLPDDARGLSSARGAVPDDELVLLTPVLTARESTGPAPRQG